MLEKSPTVALEVISASIKIIDEKFDGKHYAEWRKTNKMFLMVAEKEDHLTADPPEESIVRDKRLQEDIQLYGMIEKTLDKSIKHVLSHSEIVKDLWEYMKFVYSGKENLSRIYKVSQEFHHPEQKDNSL